MLVSRRHFLQRSLAFSAGFAGFQTAVARQGADFLASPADPAGGYGPLIPDPRGLFDLPEGFAYHVISRTGERMDDGLLVPARHDGMAAFPGPDGLTILVRNHEIEPAQREPGAFGHEDELLHRIDQRFLFDKGAGRGPSRGGTTTIVYDTRSGEAPGRVVRQFLSLAGTERNCAGGPTPRNTWISCEESDAKAGGPFGRDHGWCFEVPATTDIALARPEPIVPMGRFYHEACATNPYSGAVYLTEDRHDGVLFRYLPDHRDRLHEGGRLQALRIVGKPKHDTRNWQGHPGMQVGERVAVEWIDVENVESPDDSLRYQAYENGAARFARAEGMWHGRGAVYFACTNGGAAHCGQIFRYIPCPPDIEGTPAEADIPGALELFLESPSPGVMENADNITVAPWGDLIVCEDGSEDQYLLGVTPKGDIYRIGRNAMNHYELAGSTFSPDGSVLFVNIQIPGMTLAIRGPWGRAAR
ncbi:MAG: alkaline phosphatase PhoX [Planctomycetota bacterium]|nr:alkaline phosphatase PhoX [Planctomycetota bacterium]